MILFAAIVPPESVVNAALDVVRRAGEGSGTAGAQRKGPRWGLGRRAARPAGNTLTTYPLERIHVNLARFGNLTTPDAVALAAALVAEGVGWPALTLRLDGAMVLETSRTRAIALNLQGDLDDLARMSRGVKGAAERRGLFLDRRDFRAVLPLAPLTDPVPGPDGQAALDALAGFEGESWTATHLVLLGEHSDTAPYQEIARVELGSPA